MAINIILNKSRIMKLQITTSKNSKSLYVTKSFRENGKYSSKVIEKLGTYEELLKKLDGADPIEWAKEYIHKLNLQEKEERRDIYLKVNPIKKITKDSQVCYNCGYLFLQKIYTELGLDKICKDISIRHKFEFDLSDILSKLLYSRILFPASKLATCELSKNFIEQPTFDLQHVYRALNVLSDESDFIQSSLFKNSLKLGERKTGVIYYDCTNYFFEIEEADGIKQYGVSKEFRPNPIVQMGLFMDAEGLPLAFSINPGNTNEQVTMQPLEEKLSTKFGLSKFVVCTDAGLSSLENRKYNDVGERAFITTQSLKKVVGHIKDWALSPDKWGIIGDEKVYNINNLDPDIDYHDTTFYKERWMNENGLSQRIIVTYSIKYRDFVRAKRNNQIERAKSVIGSRPSKISLKTNSDYKRLIKQEHCTVDGEIAQINTCSLNLDKISDEERYDGFYAMSTNLEDNVLKIIEINKRRWEIEESFRIMKTEFKARPVYLQREDRIKAHFITCFLSLMIFRMLEKRMDYKYTCEKLIDTIANMNLYKVLGEGYIPTYIRTEITDDLHTKFNFRLDNQIIVSQKMKKIMAMTKK